MIQKTVKKLDMQKDSSIKEDLAYWLSKTPQDRIAVQKGNCLILGLPARE